MVFVTEGRMRARHGQSVRQRLGRVRCCCAWSRVGRLLECILRIELLIISILRIILAVESLLVSPASPENAIRVCLFNALVLSSLALRMVAPLMAAFEAAMMVKSLPLRPSKTSLHTVSISTY